MIKETEVEIVTSVFLCAKGQFLFSSRVRSAFWNSLL